MMKKLTIDNNIRGGEIPNRKKKMKKRGKRQSAFLPWLFSNQKAKRGLWPIYFSSWSHSRSFCLGWLLCSLLLFKIPHFQTILFLLPSSFFFFKFFVPLIALLSSLITILSFLLYLHAIVTSLLYTLWPLFQKWSDFRQILFFACCLSCFHGHCLPIRGSSSR